MKLFIGPRLLLETLTSGEKLKTFGSGQTDHNEGQQ